MQSGAAALLRRLMEGLQRSLALASDPELAVSAYSASGAIDVGAGDAAAAAAAAAQRGGDKAGAPDGELLQQLLAAVRGSDPTVADSYPELPLPPAGLADAWRMLPGQEQERVDVTSIVHSVVLQVRRRAGALP